MLLAKYADPTPLAQYLTKLFTVRVDVQLSLNIYGLSRRQAME